MSQTHPEPIERGLSEIHHGYLLLSVADDDCAATGGWMYSLHHYDKGVLMPIDASGNKGLLIRRARLMNEAHAAAVVDSDDTGMMEEPDVPIDADFK